MPVTRYLVFKLGAVPDGAWSCSGANRSGKHLIDNDTKAAKNEGLTVLVLLPALSGPKMCAMSPVTPRILK